MDVRLRLVAPGDIDHFFQHQRDPDARWMAASTSSNPDDREAFAARWARTLAEPSVVARTIEGESVPIGYVASFVRQGNREVAYWLGREFWGRGLATTALGLFLAELVERPLHARAAVDNVASLRVLEKCGFVAVAKDSFRSAARECEVDEVVLALAKG
ncbi:GNAT family N-acetyltransferase [Vulgatibacter sp.]|uniref:GNAT family N-acetyltransferase n=1 Tax=Vulgatibacter sp. TaxID=1971226 RepID=UPI003562C40F